MKAIFLIPAFFVITQAFAYNTNSTAVNFGEYTQVKTSAQNVNDARIVSLIVAFNSTTGQFPKVFVSDRDLNSCSHKQTLIMFSGYDLVTKTHKRVYEIQIQREPSKPCYLAVYAPDFALDKLDKSQEKVKVARVNILPSK